MKVWVVLGWVIGVAACGSSSSTPSTSSSSSSSSGGGGSSGSESGDPSQGKPSGPGNGITGTSCAKPTGLYDEKRGKPSSGSACQPGTFEQPVDFSDPPPLNPPPDCTFTRDVWSGDGCTHTVVTDCTHPQQTCTESITFAPDLSSYTGSDTCTGIDDGVDGPIPFTCGMSIQATRKR
jgi:hypothetical protein